MKSRRKRALSARKPAKSALSPHASRKRRRISPQVGENHKKPAEQAKYSTAFGHADNYATAFTYAGPEFWKDVESIRTTTGRTIAEQTTLGREALEKVDWKSKFPREWQVELVRAKGDFCVWPRVGTQAVESSRAKGDFCIWPRVGKTVIIKASEAISERTVAPIWQNFALCFVEAVRHKNFPKRLQARARFLGDSLGRDGEVSARRSRDSVGEERQRSNQEAQKAAAQFYIQCCGRKRWTVEQVCPECGRSPFPLQLPF